MNHPLKNTYIKTDQLSNSELKALAKKYSEASGYPLEEDLLEMGAEWEYLASVSDSGAYIDQITRTDELYGLDVSEKHLTEITESDLDNILAPTIPPEYKLFTGTLGEFFELYLAGEEFYSLDAGHAYKLDSDMRVVDMKECFSTGVYTKTTPNWWDNIGEGILCWVWDDDYEDEKLKLVVTGKDTICFAAEAGTFWENAQPMTEQEIMKYIYKGS